MPRTTDSSQVKPWVIVSWQLRCMWRKFMVSSIIFPVRIGDVDIMFPVGLWEWLYVPLSLSWEMSVRSNPSCNLYHVLWSHHIPPQNTNGKLLPIADVSGSKKKGIFTDEDKGKRARLLKMSSFAIYLFGDPVTQARVSTMVESKNRRSYIHIDHEYISAHSLVLRPIPDQLLLILI